MSIKDKLTLKRDWIIAGNGRVQIVGATYLQALVYKEHLRRYYGERIRDLHNKPILN